MRLFSRGRAAAAAALVLGGSACSSTLHSLPVPAYGAGRVSLGGRVQNEATREGYATLRLRIWVPGRTHDSAAHRALPAYVSSATRKVAVTVQGAKQTTPTTQKFSCTAVCTGKIVAPIGVDLIALQLEDKKNRILSRGSATVLVFKTNGNVFDFTLDGVPASVALVPESNVLPVVPASAGYLNFEARDADGRIITPDGHYTDANGNPLVFDVKSSNGAYRLAVKTVSAPGAPIPYYYNGMQHVGHMTLTVKAARGIHSPVKFHPTMLTLVPGIAKRISPPIPLQVQSATQVPLSGSAAFDPNVFFVLGNSGGQSAALGFNTVTGEYGVVEEESTGAPFASPPIDLGDGNGFNGDLEFGNNLWNPEYVGPFGAGYSFAGTTNPCSSSTPIGHDQSNTLLCQFPGFPGYVWDATHSVLTGYGQDRKIEAINGVDYFVTVNEQSASPPGVSVYASGSSTAIPGAISVGANVTSTTTGYYGDADGTVKVIGGSTAVTFSHPIEAVIGSGSNVYAYENGGIFGVYNASGTTQTAPLPIGNVVEVVTGVGGAPMLVESDGTLDVMGI